VATGEERKKSRDRFRPVHRKEAPPTLDLFAWLGRPRRSGQEAAAVCTTLGWAGLVIALQRARREGGQAQVARRNARVAQTGLVSVSLSPLSHGIMQPRGSFPGGHEPRTGSGWASKRGIRL